MDPLLNEQKGKIPQKRFNDHLGIKMSVKMKKIPEEKRANKEIINFRNKDGWKLYKAESDRVADTITQIAKDKNLTIDEVRDKICSIDEKIQKECFGTIWIKPKRKTKHKPKPKKEVEELFKEQLDDLLEMVKTGTNYKDANRKIWKMKEMVVGPKVGPAEPACINNPITGKLITNKESIKSTSLAYCVKILTKNPIRECDKPELKMRRKPTERYWKNPQSIRKNTP